MMKYAFYSDDWYILIDENGKFYYDCIEENNDALKEIKATLAVLAEKRKQSDIESYILSFKREAK